ncbi:MAG: hypothetical protein JO142_04895 [Burkholderiales bacterium]|nr:hypothetical protein [Burkholderiales bacterium]
MWHLSATPSTPEQRTHLIRRCTADLISWAGIAGILAWQDLAQHGHLAWSGRLIALAAIIAFRRLVQLGLVLTSRGV